MSIFGKVGIVSEVKSASWPKTPLSRSAVRPYARKVTAVPTMKMWARSRILKSAMSAASSIEAPIAARIATLRLPLKYAAAIPVNAATIMKPSSAMLSIPAW